MSHVKFIVKIMSIGFDVYVWGAKLGIGAAGVIKMCIKRKIIATGIFLDVSKVGFNCENY